MLSTYLKFIISLIFFYSISSINIIFLLAFAHSSFLPGNIRYYAVLAS